jgi:DNA-binding CsgD family transcriptional regulator
VELWERSAALERLDGALQATGTAGRVVVVAGEAGIGKSTLVHAFADRCGARARMLWGVCDPLLTPRASGPLHDIARQLGGGFAAQLGANAREAFAALVEELAGPRQRTRPVLVIEDAHWADGATLDLLVYLGRRIERLPALLIVTYRDDEAGPDHPMAAALATLPRSAVTTVTLAPLSPECVQTQAARTGRDATEVYELTGGNPLLVTELLATDERQLPATARALIAARLRRLSPAAREVARLVSVFPTSTDAGLLTGSEEAVDECIAAGVLVASGDAVAYRHEVFRRAVEESLSPTRRIALHRQALDLLTRVDGTDPARLVHHARQAGDTEALLRHGTVAAAGAAAQGAHREALAHYQAIRPHTGRLADGERADLLEAHAVEAYLTGEWLEGLEVRRAALAIRERLGDRRRVAENLWSISRLAWWSGQGPVAREANDQAVATLEGLPPSRELAMAYSNRSSLHFNAHEPDEAIAWGERARALADAPEVGDPETAIHAAVSIHAAALLRGDEAAPAQLWQVHKRAAAAGLVDQASRALTNRVSGLLSLCRYDEAAAATEEALRYMHAHDLDGFVQCALSYRAIIALERRDWGSALADAEVALSRRSRIGVSVLPALVARGRIEAAQGASQALSTLDHAADLAYTTGEIQWMGPVAAARAEYFLLTDDESQAAAEVDQAMGLATGTGQRWSAGDLAFRRWQATGSSSVAGSTPFELLIRGDWSGAAHAWAARGRGYARVEALGAGDRDAVSEALKALDDLGAARSAQRLRARLRKRGMSGVPRGPRRSTAANAKGLTARQLEVLALVAEGLTNADIATTLTLSPKTVEHHISAVFEKLDVTTRGQAAAAARRLQMLA